MTLCSPPRISKWIPLPYSQFLGCQLTPDQTDQLVEHLDFKNFKNNPAVNNEVWKNFGLTCNEGNFIRKGRWLGERIIGQKLRNKFVNGVQSNSFYQSRLNYECFFTRKIFPF